MPYGLDELRLMWHRRNLLLAIGSLVQGSQYLIRPDRALHAGQYALLRSLGVTGWRTLGVVLMILAALLMLVDSDTVHTPLLLRGTVFVALGLFFGFLFIAGLLNGFYVTATLILPLGLALSEIEFVEIVPRRPRRTHPGERECG